ncbi:MAG: hypothetical protein H7644_13155 [Candidatus Heimdallarchaeota archaeon]|jgi:hypothetical protein|nr:hypothetical protein [Candidatus Heimdallarchaeota archaeon]MCK5144707.1 hypothetical protein [Candidatus Heimdallarchaeota archaeon]
MSIRQNVVKTLKTVKEEYGKVDFGDKLLDLISIVGIVLFLASFISVFLSRVFNAVNIVFMLYPLGLAGIAASFRMKKRDKPEEAEKLFKEWVWIFGTFTVISIIIIILGFVLA